MSAPVDRRAFLAAIGGAGAALLAGCGSSEQSHTAASAASAPARSARPSLARRSVATTGPRTLQAAVRGHVFARVAPLFVAAAHVYNTRFDGVRPDAVARVLDSADARDAVRFTVAHGIPVRARSGGHSYAGYSTLNGGVVIDLRKLDHVIVDRAAGTATVGAGAQLIDIYAKLAAAGATLPAGSCPSVGVSGVTLGGGFGLAGRALGLTTDHLIAARIITADGALRTVEAGTDPDLLWALRGGGGGNFGIVTEFTFRIHPLPASAAYFNIVWPWSSAGEAIEAWQAWISRAPEQVSSILHLNAGSPPSITTNGQYLGGSGALQSLLAPLLRVSGARLTGLGDMSYLPLQLVWAGCEKKTLAACHTVGSAPGGVLPRNTFNAKSDYVGRPLPSQGVAAMVAAAESSAGAGAILCDSYGAAINRVAPTATAFVHRQELFCIQYYGDGAGAAWIDQAWRKLRPYVSGYAYQNYIDPTLSGWQHAYYGENYPRLMRTREQVDPHHYFNFPQAVG